MATTTFDQAPQQTTDGQFQAWVAPTDAAIISIWGARTADTGQINTATVTHPTLANEKQGYSIYKTLDTLDGTQSIWWRIDYGSGSAATIPSVWITLGTGSDGAGTITAVGGSVFGPLQIQGAASATVYRSYVSGTNAGARARLCVAMFAGVTGSADTTANFFWSIERSKNAAGADTAAGVIFLSAAILAASTRSQYYKPLAASQPLIENVWCAATPKTGGTMIDGLLVGVAAPVPLSPAPQQPGANTLVAFNTDFTPFQAFVFTLYGTSITWLPLPLIAGALTTSGTSNIPIMRFD